METNAVAVLRFAEPQLSQDAQAGSKHEPDRSSVDIGRR